MNELSGSEIEDQNMEGRELRIPVVMVLFVLLCYCGIGGLLFCKWEGWSYFEGFYFCFITMATVGWSVNNFIFGRKGRFERIRRGFQDPQ